MLLLLSALVLLWDKARHPKLRTNRAPNPLRERWWLNSTADQLPPVPKLDLPVEPDLNFEPAITTHSWSQIASLKSAYTKTAPPDWTAAIHLSSAAQIQFLVTLVPALQRQRPKLDRILVFAPNGMTPDLKIYGPELSLLSYPPSRSSAGTFVNMIASSVTSKFVLVVDGSRPSIEDGHVESLLRIAMTKEYDRSLLTTGGLVLSASGSTCQSAPLATSRRLHAPSDPFLVQTEWFKAPMLTNGLRADLPLEITLAHAFWTRVAIPVLGVPLGLTSRPEQDWSCDRLQRAALTGAGQVASYDMKRRPRSLTPEDDLKAAIDLQDGVVVLVLSGDAEVQAAHGLACSLSRSNDVRILVTDYDGLEGSQVIFGQNYRCHLEITRLGTGSDEENVQSLVVAQMDKIGDVSVVFYAKDGKREREFWEVLKWMNAHFGGRSSTRNVSDDTLIAIALPISDLARGDWIGSLHHDALRSWHTPKIDLSIVTNKRPQSLNRLLVSLRKAFYFGDDVTLTISEEQTADDRTRQIVDELEWPYGTKNVRHRVILGGLLPAIVESWYPASNDSYGVLLEDDVEVSPHFYAWLKFAILHYRYTPDIRNASTRLFGISLYQQKNVELRPEGRKAFDARAIFKSLPDVAEETPYLSQIPCSWGAAYFPETWREFHSYLSLRLSETALSISETIVPEIRSNRWPRSWKKYFIELVYLRGYVMLYPNYRGWSSFSTNHQEKGEHIRDAVEAKKKEMFSVPLMPASASILDIPAERLPRWSELPVIDLWGTLATRQDVIERGWQSHAALHNCPTLPLNVSPSYDARELLCRTSGDKSSTLIDSRPLVRSIEILDDDNEDVVENGHDASPGLDISNKFVAVEDNDEDRDDENLARDVDARNQFSGMERIADFRDRIRQRLNLAHLQAEREPRR